jgi:16S rRNA processing protein RimM
VAERPDGLLEVGRITRAHGVRGDVYVDLSTDRVERLAPGARLSSRGQWLTVASASRQPQRWLVHFEEIPDRSTAERFTQSRLYAEPIDDPGTIWVHELIGAEVVEVGGTPRGRCVAVVENPAADLLELESGALVPMTFVVDVAAGTVTIDPPEGLFD